MTVDEGATVPYPTHVMRPILQIWQVFSNELSFGIRPSSIRSSSMLHFGAKTDRFPDFFKKSVN